MEVADAYGIDFLKVYTVFQQPLLRSFTTIEEDTMSAKYDKLPTWVSV